MGFSGTAYLMASFKLTPDYPRCHGNEFWDKIGYNSVYIRDIPEIFAYNRGFRGRAIEWRQTNFTTTTPVAMVTNFGTKSAITRLVYKICRRSLRPTRGFRGRALNNVTQILPWPTLFAMATTFETKWAITQLVWEISLRYLRLIGGFHDRAIEWRQTNSATTDPGCHGNEI